MVPSATPVGDHDQRRQSVKARLIRLGMAVAALVATASALGAGRKWH
jgi:hypothetical protein